MRTLSRLALSVTAFFLVCGMCFAAEFRRATTFEDAFKASCRVSVSNARGTGTFIGFDKEKGRCVILTNYHVVTNNNTATLDFWTNGVKESITGRVFARFYDSKKPYDFALISVDPDDLAKIAPPYVALAGKGAAPDSNSYILSAGCPKGRFVQAWKGKILGYYAGSTVEFQPAPVPGQSGSGVLSVVDGELWLTAVLTWLIGQEGADESKGGAIPVANLYDALRGGTANAAAPYNDDFSPIPPDAVECMLKEPYVEEYVRDNCRPCDQAREDVAKIKATGVDVTQINTSTKAGYEKAKERSVKSAPCFVVYDGDGKEIERFLGPGHSEAVISLINSVKPKEETPIETQEPPAEDISPLLDALELLASTQPATSDFRNRAPVYEFDSDSVYENAGFFDDSDTRWRNRRGNKEPEQPKSQSPSIINPTPIIPKIDENKLGDRIGGRLKDGLSNSINNQLDGALEYAEKRLEKKAEDMTASLMDKAKNAWNSLKWKLLGLVLSIFVIGVLIAEGIKSFLVKAYNRFLEEPYEESEENETKDDQPKRRKTKGQK